MANLAVTVVCCHKDSYYQLKKKNNFDQNMQYFLYACKYTSSVVSPRVGYAGQEASLSKYCFLDPEVGKKSLQYFYD